MNSPIFLFLIITLNVMPTRPPQAWQELNLLYLSFHWEVDGSIFGVGGAPWGGNCIFFFHHSFHPWGCLPNLERQIPKSSSLAHSGPHSSFSLCGSSSSSSSSSSSNNNNNNNNNTRFYLYHNKRFSFGETGCVKKREQIVVCYLALYFSRCK